MTAVHRPDVRRSGFSQVGVVHLGVRLPPAGLLGSGDQGGQLFHFGCVGSAVELAEILGVARAGHADASLDATQSAG